MVSEKINNIMKERWRIEDMPLFLSVIACALLVISGLLTLFLTDSIIELIKKAKPETALNAVNITWLAIAWLALAYLLFLALYNLKRKANRNWMYFKLVIGILAVLTANIIGIIVIISALLHLIRDIKLKKQIVKKEVNH